MASYLIKYLDGEAETVKADALEELGGQYVGFADGVLVVYVPTNNVRSVVRQTPPSKGAE